MPPPEKDNIEPVTHRRRVRKHRRNRVGADLKKHVGFIVIGTNTERIQQQIKDGDISWEGEYRE